MLKDQMCFIQIVITTYSCRCIWYSKLQCAGLCLMASIVYNVVLRNMEINGLHAKK